MAKVLITNSLGGKLLSSVVKGDIAIAPYLKREEWDLNLY